MSGSTRQDSSSLEDWGRVGRILGGGVTRDLKGIDREES